MNGRYIPDAGDIVWLQFDLQAGHEQAGHRPALVLSPAKCNGKTGLMLCCPMTTQIKGYPFEVIVSGEKSSAVLADQVKSLDLRAYMAKRKGQISAAELAQIRPETTALIMGSKRKTARHRASKYSTAASPAHLPVARQADSK